MPTHVATQELLDLAIDWEVSFIGRGIGQPEVFVSLQEDIDHDHRQPILGPELPDSWDTQEDQTIHTRRWVLQERLMAAREIHFT